MASIAAVVHCKEQERARVRLNEKKVAFFSSCSPRQDEMLLTSSAPTALSLLVLDNFPQPCSPAILPQVKAVRKERPVDLVVAVKGQEVALQVRAMPN